MSGADENFDYDTGLSSFDNNSDGKLDLKSDFNRAKKREVHQVDVNMTSQMSQLQSLVGDMKEGFVTAMQALAQIQHGDQVLQEKVDSNKAQYENQLADVLKMVVSLKSEFSGILSQLNASSSNQRLMQRQVETLQYERDVLLEELEKAGSISSQVRKKYHTGSKRRLGLNPATSLTALLERTDHNSTIRPNGSSNSIHVTSDHDSGVNSGIPGDSCDDSPTSAVVSPLMQSYIANLSQSQQPVALPEEGGEYESDCCIAAAANQSLDLSRSLIDDLDDLVVSEDDKEGDEGTKKTSENTETAEPPVSEFRPIDTPKKIAPHERSAKHVSRLKIANELLETEKKYCSCLWTLLDHFAGQLKEKEILSITDISEMFPPCLAHLYDQHCALLQALEQRLSSSKYQCILGDILFKFIQDSQCDLLKLYQTYMKEFPRSMQSIKEMAQSNVQFRKFLREAQKDPCCEGLDVGAFLLTPVQRMPRYVLLLKQMLNHTEIDHPDHYYIETSLRNLGDFLNVLNDSIQHSLHRNKPKRRFSILSSFRQNSSTSVNSVRNESGNQSTYVNQRLGTSLFKERPSSETIYGNTSFIQSGLQTDCSSESFVLSEDVSQLQDNTGKAVPKRSKKQKNKHKKDQNKYHGSNSLTHSASFHSSHSESNCEPEFPQAKPPYRRPQSVTEEMLRGFPQYGVNKIDPRRNLNNTVCGAENSGRYYPKPPPQFSVDTSTPNVYGLKSQSAGHFGVFGDNESDVDADISSSTNPVSVHSPSYLRSHSCVDMSQQQSDSIVQERINIALARSLTCKDRDEQMYARRNGGEEAVNGSIYSQRQRVLRSQTLDGSGLPSDLDWTFTETPRKEDMVRGTSRKVGKKKSSKEFHSESALDQSSRKKKPSLKQSIKNIFFRKRGDTDCGEDEFAPVPVLKECEMKTQ